MTTHTPIPDAELNEMEAEVNGATEGPWDVSGHPADPEIRDSREWLITNQICSGVENEDDSGTRNAAFISASRTNLPRLIAEVRALRVVILEKLHDDCHACRDGWPISDFGGGLYSHKSPEGDFDNCHACDLVAALPAPAKANLK